MNNEDKYQSLVNRLISEHMPSPKIRSCVSNLIFELGAQNCPRSDVQDLISPIPDWERTLQENGFTKTFQGAWSNLEGSWFFYSPEEICENQGFQPVEVNPFDFCVVSELLAERLEGKGEKISGFAGLEVWVRTKQYAFELDPFLRQIALELYED